MFKRVASLLVVCVSLGLAGGCVNSNLGGALSDAYTAVTISDAELVQLSRKMRAEGDRQNRVAGGNDKYGKRLDRLTKRFRKEDGLDLNYKVYITPEVNANATADGSIRMYSGLMDMMTDNEVIFVIGHEIGHVASGDSLGKIRMAYGTSSAIKGAAAVSGTAAAVLSSAQLGELLHSVLNAQYSQNREFAADAYAYTMMKKYKVDTKAAVSALEKLGGGPSSIMSSHPASADRAKAIQKMIDADKKK